MSRTHEVTSARQRLWSVLSLGLAFVAGAAAVWAVLHVARLPAAPKPQPAPRPAATMPERGTLVGDWIRADGSYTLRIRGVDATGQVDAMYLNPNPIHVSAARASNDGGDLRLSIELRDVGYPGCTYTLRYSPGDDRLAGSYFQAGSGRRYDVSFSRLPR